MWPSAGLVLLMAMAETGGRGFFMLDEPFAQLDPASQLIVLRKKRVSEPTAPCPLVAGI